jgi:hypothetical protein
MAVVGLGIYFILRKKCRTRKETIRDIEKSPSPVKEKEENSMSAIKAPTAVRRSAAKKEDKNIDLESSTR